jgi:S-(hydroxymethyl)glutathione dehydrogenase/alcohol dehydrogenase
MKTRTAILRDAPGKFEVLEADLDEPRAGEVLVKLGASGLCHSDDHLATGDLLVPVYPIAGGTRALESWSGSVPGSRRWQQVTT